jgi:hypothetical protein
MFWLEALAVCCDFAWATKHLAAFKKAHIYKYPLLQLNYSLSSFFWPTSQIANSDLLNERW